jgi:hypothetical protein
MVDNLQATLYTEDLRIYASREGRKETSDILEVVQFNPQKTRRL